MRSNQQHTFSQVPQANIQRSTFSRTHSYKTTFYSGYLIPFLLDEVLPGDTFNVHATMFARLSTPLVPTMDNIFLDTFYFFVPNRLVWTHWPNFMGEEATPGDVVNNVVSYVMPKVLCPAGGWPVHSVADYFGIPTGVSNLVHQALPFRAYNLIWNEWFRDENLQNKRAQYNGDGPDNDTYPVIRRGKRHDYFTSALPWPQKGPGVMVPLGTSAPVVPTGSVAIPKFRHIQEGNGNAVFQSNVKLQSPISSNTVIANPSNTNATYVGTIGWDATTGLMADLSGATAATINSLRQAFQIQRLYERDARGGSRYTELVRSHFGVISPDARLQRPEFLGGGTTRVNISPVAQTSASGATGTTTPLAGLAAIGTAGGASGFTKSFTEHGHIIGMLEVRTDINYQRSLNRMWSRNTKLDYYWPVLSNLGEQAILNQEIYAQGIAGTGATQDQGVFGYQERWAEYRYFPSLITGQMNSHAASTLDVWHLAQKFTALPTLNDTFIQDTPPINRMLADQVRPEFILDSFIDIRATRPMPVYSVPGLIDHF